MRRTTRHSAGHALAMAMSLAGPGLLAGCGEMQDEPGPAPVQAIQQAATAEDGLADAYAQFKQTFKNNGFDQVFPIGYGFHPGLSTEKLVSGGHTPRGTARLDFTTKRVQATLDDVPAGVSFDLWFVKNIAGAGHTVRPETTDTLLKVGTFTGTAPSLSLDVLLNSNINFDLDLVVVTRKGKPPTSSRVAVGSRTLFEKRFFREKAGKTLDPVSGTIANNIETADALVGRGAQLFFKETFAGNGRTCGTCHRAERNLTIDAAFIATLPQSDPLFVAETNPALAQLEDPALMRQRGLIRENLDGFDDPTHKFVARGVPHTLALNQTNGIEFAGFGFPSAPPDQRTGWGGDGAPGRGTLNEFAFGAIVQHFTKTLTRTPGTDFRVPTQEELDALEAFQLFTGRQKLVDVNTVQLRDTNAENGRNLFLGQAACTVCHNDLSGFTFNSNFSTGVVTLTPDLPVDDGFLDTTVTNGFGEFNVPPLLEAADSEPLFHNNSEPNIEAVVNFYTSPAFASSPDGFTIVLTSQEQLNVAAFLREVNAAENIRQVRKRAQFVRDHRSSGNTDLLTVAIADTADAIRMLAERNLNLAARNNLANVKQTLEIAKANPDANRPAFMDNALTFLGIAKNDLLSSNPNNQF